MDFRIVQRIDFRYYLDARRAQWLHFDGRGERYQPLFGLIIAGASLYWMLRTTPQGVGAVASSFVLFWGIFLIIRRTLLWIAGIIVMAYQVRTLSFDEMLRFFECGYSRTDFSGTQRFQWEDVRDALFDASGITLLNRCNSIFFISGRATPDDDYEKVQSFLCGKFAAKMPDREFR